MPLYLENFIEILAELCEEKKLKAAVSGSLKGGLITGVGTVVGGLLLGPIGLAIGGALCGATSSMLLKGNFQPVGLILVKLKPDQKQRLYEKILYAFRDFGPEDMIALSALVISQAPYKELALKVIKNYLTNELSIQVMG